MEEIEEMLLKGSFKIRYPSFETPPNDSTREFAAICRLLNTSKEAFLQKKCHLIFVVGSRVKMFCVFGIRLVPFRFP